MVRKVGIFLLITLIVTILLVPREFWLWMEGWLILVWKGATL